MSTRAPEAGPLAERLAPYARTTLERAIELAARLHADELSYEHWLVALFHDESSAAARVVLHAFADPKTIGDELLALCSGTMVVGSGRTLPFSVLAVRALHTARDESAAAGAEKVGARDLFEAAERELPPPLRERLAALARSGLSPGGTMGSGGGSREGSRGSAPDAPTAIARDDRAGEAPLLRRFSADSLRALGAACRAAGSLGRASIGPVHLLLGALDSDPDLRESTGLSSARVRIALSGSDEDSTPLPERKMALGERLRELLEGLPPGAETIDVLGWLLAHGTVELVSLLKRQKITTALVDRCRGIFRDPPPD